MGQCCAELITDLKHVRTRVLSLTNTHRYTHPAHLPLPLSLSLSLRLHCAITMVTTDRRAFRCSKCTIVIYSSLSSLIVCLYYSVHYPPRCVLSRALFQCQCAIGHPTHTHTHTHTYTHTHTHTHKERVRFFPLNLTLLPPQALLTRLVV